MCALDHFGLVRMSLTVVMGEHKQGVLGQCLSDVGVPAAVLSSPMCHKHQCPKNKHKHSFFSHRELFSCNVNKTVIILYKMCNSIGKLSHHSQHIYNSLTPHYSKSEK